MEKKMKKKLHNTAAGKSGPEALRAAKKGGAGNQVKPIYNSEGKMVFSKFDFTEEQKKDEKKTQMDPKSALKKIQKEKEKLKSLEEIGELDVHPVSIFHPQVTLIPYSFVLNIP